MLFYFAVRSYQYSLGFGRENIEMAQTRSLKNCSSVYLNTGENEEIFKLITQDSKSVCTTIAQVFETKGNKKDWIKKGSGVLCLQKNYATR